MKKLAVFFLGLVTLIFVGRQVFLPKMIEQSFAKLASQNIGINPIASLDDGLHVYMCGAGSPLPDPQRSGPCIGVVAGEQVFVFDAGTNGSQNLGPMGVPGPLIDEIFLTHLHSDHFDGLGQLMLSTWVGGRKTPVQITGPIGTAQIVDGFNTAYKIDSTYRTAHHGAAVANPAGYGGTAREVDLSGGGSKVVHDKDGVTITAFSVSHEPVDPAFGYRIDYKDRSIAISGDTAYDTNIAAAAKDVDVLFHEALNMEMVKTLESAAKANGAKAMEKIFFDIQDYHTSPVDAAKIAKQAGASDLVLYHIVPMLPRDAMIPMFVKGADKEFDGKITVSKDGTILRLPVGSDEIIYEQNTGL
ncbi:MAG: MBL fold metallo-hydrolase [Maricaulaceae bacterium]